MSYVYEYPRPALTADCLVVNPHDEVLLVRRGGQPYKGCWALPGGFMEMDETLEECAVRELHEETGVVVEPRQAGDDADAVKWWPISNLPQLAFDHQEIVETFLHRVQ